MANEFTRPVSEYKREYNFSKIAIEDLATYLSTMRDITYDDATTYIKQQLKPDGSFPLYNPTVSYLERGSNGDRSLQENDLLSYLDRITSEGLIMSPSMMVYLPVRIKKSIFGEYIELNLGLRKADKAKMFTSQMAGETEAAAYWKTMQQSRKIKNNSLSGLQASPSTPGYNLTAHTALTSLCRCATSYANSSNEKFIGGLRHYYAPGVVTNHMLTIIRVTDVNEMCKFMDDNNIHYPTADELISCVKHSSEHYWFDDNAIARIKEFAEKMHPAHRAAFVYTGDLYHFDIHNPEYTKGFLKAMGTMGDYSTINIEEAAKVIKGLDDNYLAISSLISSPEIKGIKLDKAETQRPDAYRTVAATAVNMKTVMAKYKGFIDNVIVQRYLPHSIAAFPMSQRRSVPTSDTDSTIFTVAHWVDKYGGVPFSQEAFCIKYVMVFLIAGMVQNTLMMYSANLGMSEEDISKVKMKNEFILPVYVLTAIAKHYFSIVTACEGNVYDDKDIDYDRKGVQLRSSNAPIIIDQKVLELMKIILDTVMKGELLNAKEILDFVGGIEADIKYDLMSGGYKYLNTMQIKGHESYSQGTAATGYKSYTFWNDNFSKYDPAPEPPFMAVKVTVDLPNKTAIDKWLSSIEDPVTKRTLSEWVQIEGKTSIKLFRIPITNLESHGYPKEILPVINVRGIIGEVMKPFYLILQSLGLYIGNDNRTRLVFDEHDPVKAATDDPNSGIRKVGDDIYMVVCDDGSCYYRTGDELVEEELV